MRLGVNIENYRKHKRLHSALKESKKSAVGFMDDTLIEQSECETAAAKKVRLIANKMHMNNWLVDGSRTLHGKYVAYS